MESDEKSRIRTFESNLKYFDFSIPKISNANSLLQFNKSNKKLHNRSGNCFNNITIGKKKITEEAINLTFSCFE